MRKLFFILCIITASLLLYRYISDQKYISIGHIKIKRTEFLTASTERKADVLCADCHGKDGSGDRFFGKDTNRGIPMINNLTARYLEEQLTDYRTGKRIHINSKLDDDDDADEMNHLMKDKDMNDLIIAELALYYSNLHGLPIQNNVESQLKDTNKQKFIDGKHLYQKKCASCHGAQGIPSNNSKAPRLAGQNGLYQAHILMTWMDKIKKNKPIHNPMVQYLKENPLDHVDIVELSFYLENIVGIR